MLKFCEHCKTTYQITEKDCKNKCRSKRKRKKNRSYDLNRPNKAFYHSKEWRKMRAVCIANHGSLCLWTLAKERRIVKGNLVHHIVEVSEDQSKALELGNLITLSSKAHNEIHMIYIEDKATIQEELKRIKRIWEEEGIRGSF